MDSSFKNVSALWLEDNKLFWKESTYTKYLFISKNMDKIICDCSLEKINSKIVQQTVNQILICNAMSITTIKTYISVINSVLSFAYDNDCKKETSTAEIALVSLTTKITNLITTLDFVQTEPVSDVVKETNYRVYFISDNNEKISNENIVIADKKDKDTTKRMFRLRFNFKNKKYDKSQKYYLVAYDDKNDIEILRHEIIMDVAFADDFGFFE